MGFAVNVGFLFLAFITLAISSGFALNSAVRLVGLPEYNTNDKLKTAHKYLVIAGVVGFITVFFLIVAAILSIVFIPEETEAGAVTGVSSKNYIVYGMLFLTLVATFAVGILSAIAATDIHNSGVQNNNLSYRNSIIAAVLSIIVVVLIIVALIALFVYKPKPKKTKVDTEIQTLKMKLGETENVGDRL